MIKRLARILTIFLALVFIQGCKLVTAVDEGGTLDSQSGAYDCGEFSSCEIEVTAADFDETFTAVAKGGYVFSHWRGGAHYLCAGSDDPVCQASNTQFAGNTQVEAIIASDAKYYLEPVFRALRIPTPVVIDATGKFIGTPAGYFNARHEIYVQVEGTEAAVKLRVDPLRLKASGKTYFTGTGCTGDAYITFPRTGEGYAGLLGNLVYAPDLSVEPVPGQNLSACSYTNDIGLCINNCSVNMFGDFYPAIYQEYDVTYPVIDVMR